MDMAWIMSKESSISFIRTIPSSIRMTFFALLLKSRYNSPTNSGALLASLILISCLKYINSCQKECIALLFSLYYQKQNRMLGGYWWLSYLLNNASNIELLISTTSPFWDTVSKKSFIHSLSPYRFVLSAFGSQIYLQRSRFSVHFTF